MDTVFDTIARHKLIPVVVIDRAEDAAPLGDALAGGGLPIAEITFRTDAAEAAIRALAGRSDLLVGAGTVLTTEQAARAIDAGATFLVAPGTNSKVIEFSQQRGVPIYPGVATPTDIELATSFGLNTLKFFPAETLGGVKALKAISAPFRGVRFIPTGGISADNLLHYLSLPMVVACGGSWLAPQEKLAAGDFAGIRQAAAHAVDLLTAKAT